MNLNIGDGGDEFRGIGRRYAENASEAPEEGGEKALCKCQDEAKRPETITELPRTKLQVAVTATEFVGTGYCKRFLRNLTALIGFQFFLITCLILVVVLIPPLANLIRTYWALLILINAISYVLIGLSMTLLNKLYERIGYGNYIPFLILTANLGLLLAIPVISCKRYEILFGTGLISVYFLILVFSQVVGRWEFSLPSGLLGIVLGNTIVGAVTLGVLICHTEDGKSYTFLHYCVPHLSISIVCAYLMYDIELMTTRRACHKTFEYRVLYNHSSYSALHIYADFLHGVLTLPKYVYLSCRHGCSKGWSYFIPRCGAGMGCGVYRQYSDPADVTG